MDGHFQGHYLHGDKPLLQTDVTGCTNKKPWQKHSHQIASPKLAKTEWRRRSRTVGGAEGDLWYTWTESKSGEEGGALGRASEQRIRHQTRREETETDGNLLVNTSWGKEESRRGDGK